MTQEFNTNLINIDFYTSPTKKIHTKECRHCKPNNAGWQKVDSILRVVDEGYQICRLCCPSEQEIEALRQTDKGESLTEIESSKLTSDTTNVKAKKSNSQKKVQTENPIVEVTEKEVNSPKNNPESLPKAKKPQVNQNQESTTGLIESKIDENTETNTTNQQTTKIQSQQKSNNKSTAVSSDADAEKTLENQTQESTASTESKTSVETEKQSVETESTSENQTKSKKKNKKNKQQSPENLDNQANKAEKRQKSENDTDSKSDDKSEAKTTEPKKEKKRYKILAGNGAHQAIAEVNGILVPPSEPTGKFTLVLPDGLQLEVIFRNPRLKWVAFRTNSMIGQHWFRGYPKMQNNKLVAFQVIAWDGNMPTNERGWEIWEFTGVWTLQKNLTVQRTLMDEEIKKIAKETGFIKKFKYTFNNSHEWMTRENKKLWAGYVYKLICRREGESLRIQKVIPFACPRIKPLPPGSKPPQGKGNFKQKGDFK